MDACYHLMDTRPQTNHNDQLYLPNLARPSASVDTREASGKELGMAEEKRKRVYCSLGYRNLQVNKTKSYKLGCNPFWGHLSFVIHTIVRHSTSFRG